MIIFITHVILILIIILISIVIVSPIILIIFIIGLIIIVCSIIVITVATDALHHEAVDVVCARVEVGVCEGGGAGIGSL